MKYEKGLLFKLMILKRYGFDIEQYKLNKSVREFYAQKRCENGKKRNVEMYREIFSFINGRDIDRDRFYYIFWEMGECLAELEQYGEACKYFKIAIDNVITESYKKNNLKFKSRHYDVFLKGYFKAVGCFIKASRFDDADYYDNLNMYLKDSSRLPCEYMGDLYASLGAKNPATKYYDEKICEIENIIITREYDYDPYRDGYLEDEYKRKMKRKEDEINRIFQKIKSI